MSLTTDLRCDYYIADDVPQGSLNFPWPIEENRCIEKRGHKPPHKKESQVESVTLGPFELIFLPDGDDPGTGAMRIRTGFGLEGTTPMGVSRGEWVGFLKELNSMKGPDEGISSHISD